MITADCILFGLWSPLDDAALITSVFAPAHEAYWKWRGYWGRRINSCAMWQVSCLNLCRRMSYPLPFYSLFLLMMDSCRRCKCDAHTQWNLPCLCFHLHLFSLVFLHVAVCVGKNGEMHTQPVQALMCVVCIGKGWGMFSFSFFLLEK